MNTKRIKIIYVIAMLGLSMSFSFSLMAKGKTQDELYSYGEFLEEAYKTITTGSKEQTSRFCTSVKKKYERSSDAYQYCRKILARIDEAKAQPLKNSLEIDYKYARMDLMRTIEELKLCLEGFEKAVREHLDDNMPNPPSLK